MVSHDYSLKTQLFFELRVESDMGYIDLKVYLSKLLKNWLVIVLCSVIGMSVAFIYSEFFATPIYASTLKIGVFNSDWTTGVSSNDIETASKLMENCLVVLKDDIMAGEIADVIEAQTGEKYTSSQIKGAVSYSQIEDSQWIQVVARTGNPELSALLCNAVSAKASDIIVESVANVQMRTLGEAKVNYNPISPNTSKNTILGFMVGFVAVCLVIFLITFFDKTINDTEIVKEKYGLAVLGVIPNVAEDGKKNDIKKRKRFV